jgi:hypothetical protein
MSSGNSNSGRRTALTRRRHVDLLRVASSGCRRPVIGTAHPTDRKDDPP